ncbi:ABC transporter ATP-binding protein [Thermodesulfovibrionales bacterium]|nr:ABC transporter ATP-binding protein [Thermodesulfovibrionales bacterium]MCL0061549.1 ABC transporter ATP-binding protein [Thermodesulfovibrionales bacterium]MCL0071354.1 ABC transporter ATP-binding protein [Thermodesulfovibrionales bacterium]
MIEIIDLHKSFGKNHVLQGVNLKVDRGESMVVMGGSGSGKTILIKHIIRLLRPDSGKAIVDGRDMAELNEKELYKMRKRFGMLFQSAALFDSLSVWENVGFALLRERQMKESDVKKIAIEELKVVGLTGVEDLMPSELSGGMKKRVGLARAIIHNPEILLYDEPTTGLDPILANTIGDLILELKKRLSVTSVTITHDIQAAYKIADRIAMLFKGRIIETGRPDEIKNTTNPVVRQFISGGLAASGEDLEEVV